MTLVIADKCQHCEKADAVWAVLDSREHRYYRVYLTKRLQLNLDEERCQDAYLLCDGCRRKLEASNRSARPTKKRRLEFLKWKDADG